MATSTLLRGVLDNDALSRNLGDIEAAMLFRWTAEWAELLEENCESTTVAAEAVARLVRRARGIAKFVSLWSWPDSRASAFQLAASEQFRWPMPDANMDADGAMAHILTWEDKHMV